MPLELTRRRDRHTRSSSSSGTISSARAIPSGSGSAWSSGSEQAPFLEIVAIASTVDAAADGPMLDGGLAFLRPELATLAQAQPEEAERLCIPARVEAIDGAAGCGDGKG